MRGERALIKPSPPQFLNLTVSLDRRAILLNNEPIHPLRTIPIPPRFHATQFPATFSNKNLSAGIECPNPHCLGGGDACEDWCKNLPLSAINLEYLYTVKEVQFQESDRDAGSRYWEVQLDVIGGQGMHKNGPHWNLDNASQKMLWMRVAGKETSSPRSKATADSKTSGDLFGQVGWQDHSYEYRIVDVNLRKRVYDFSAKKTLSVWGKIRRFFGNDVWQNDGSQFLYLDEQWGLYGKKGTLRNMFGEIVHWHVWPLIWIILGSTIGGLIFLYSTYKLGVWIMQQRGLANWDGMDDVWDRLRREPAYEEEDALLDGGYRDDPAEGSSSMPRYTDEPQGTKPLPSKPLPEKPLPAVPLIDA